MKIRLLMNIPVALEHGMDKGREFEVVRLGEKGRNVPKWWVLGDAGEEIGIGKHEAEEVGDGHA